MEVECANRYLTEHVRRGQIGVAGTFAYQGLYLFAVIFLPAAARTVSKCAHEAPFLAEMGSRWWWHQVLVVHVGMMADP